MPAKQVQVHLMVSRPAMRRAARYGHLAPTSPCTTGRAGERLTQYLLVTPHMALLPGGVLALTVLWFNILRDAVRDALDPKLTER